ncbi:hypothetical protein C8R44DRAFT_855920 [Mycena epipterygia]|nr:hypothetical protein C8R44DRAFT_855920 [Mycena epipterygia]
MHLSPANHPCLVCGRATSRCQTAWDCSAEQSATVTDTRSNFPAEESTPNVQLKPPRDRFVPDARPVRAAEPPLTVGINRNNEAASGDTGGGTSNTADINGSMPTSLDRISSITLYGGQGGKGGDAGGTGGAGGAGQGNHLQIYLAGSDITLNVYHGGRDRDLEFVIDMVMCLAWLGLSTLTLACLHLVFT